MFKGKTLNFYRGKVVKALSVMSVFACLLSLCPLVSRAEEEDGGQWELQEDGKHWRYEYSPEDWAKDEWIDVDGKEYYVDSKGYMKTGWVTDKESGNRYYLGEDGAKCYNMFTPDDKYVGPEGIQLKLFDAYRKAAKKELRSILKGKWIKELPEGQSPEFLLADLNDDKYRDLVVLIRDGASQRLLLAAVWNPPDKKFVISAEGDHDGGGNFRLSRNEWDQITWMRIQESDGAVNYFTLEDGGYRFKSDWVFSTDTNDWDDIIYYVNGDEAEEDEYRDSMAEAEQESGTEIRDGYMILSEENILQAVDTAPAEDELDLWEGQDEK